MFGFSTVFQSLKNLGTEINRMTSLFKAANDQLEARMGFNAAELDAIEHRPDPFPPTSRLPMIDLNSNDNGHAATKRTKASKS